MTEIDLESLADVTGGRIHGMPLAKRAALNFSAAENHVLPSTLKVDSAKAFGVEAGRRYYGVKVNNGDLLNVGLSKGGYRVKEINYVGDGA